MELEEEEVAVDVVDVVEAMVMERAEEEERVP